MLKTTIRSTLFFGCFLILIGGIYYCVKFKSLLFMRPMGEHAWAQIDRASQALQYFQRKASFLLPQTHNIASNPSAVACGEFPLQPFLVSCLYRCFGFHEYLYRLCVVGFALIGFIFSYLISCKFLKNEVLSLLAALGWILSPNLIYYSTGFVPDTFALTLLLSAFYFLTRNFPHFTTKNVWWFAFFSALSMLEKSSVIFIYFPLCLALLFHSRNEKQEWKCLMKQTGILCLPIVVLIGWLIYARYLQLEFNSNIFLLQPKFPQSLHELYFYLKGFSGKIKDYYSVYMILFFAAALLMLIRNIHKVPLFFKILIAGSSFGWFVFFITLSRQAWFHGYYHVPFQFVIFMVLLIAFQMVEQHEKLKKYISIVVLLTGMVYISGFVNISSYFEKRAWHHELINPDWYDADEALTAMGVNRQSKMVTYADKSYNISLYLMNRQGWNLEENSWDYYIKNALQTCDFIIITNPEFLNHKIVKPFVGKFIGKHKSLWVYSIKKNSI